MAGQKKPKFVYLDKFERVRDAIKNKFSEHAAIINPNTKEIMRIGGRIDILQKNQDDLRRSVRNNRIAIAILYVTVVTYMLIKY